MSVSLKALHRVYQLSLKSKGKCFSNSLFHPQVTQECLLKSIVKKNETSIFGREYSFDSIKDVSQYRSRVPLTKYEDYVNYIDSIRVGESNQLTAESVRFFEPTSGSSGPQKLIPYTQSLLDAFNSATKPWLWNLSLAYPKAFTGQHYWSVSPAHEQEVYQSTIPVGMNDDSEYFDPVSRWFINKIMAVPSSVRCIKNEHEWQFATALKLLQTRDLSLISVWSPTFLTVLLEFINNNFKELTHALTPSRRAEIFRVTGVGEVDFEHIWSNLGLISCWTDGISQRFASVLGNYFPNTPIQGKGLLTTECVVSIPWHETDSFDKHEINNTEPNTRNPLGHVLAIGSHFLEFLPLGTDRQETCLSHELIKGQQYIPVVTTQGGLYRYQLQDIVECIGYVGTTPKIQFVGKLDHISDLAGEKIHSGLVEKAMAYASNVTGFKPDFALLTPPRDIPGKYCLYIESTQSNMVIDTWSDLVERSLSQSHHYQYAQRLQQLQPLMWRRVYRGWMTYQSTLQSRGIKLGDIKPIALETRVDWHSIFAHHNPQLEQRNIEVGS
ncbi:GH3 family domain-containing protein [Pleionea sediminis]|uniref:GH3 family domain-containing protein n=1 Tax=Pleionea sediminis TaxID=2569479 RepID=UPI0011851B60|nr:GH3 auxin-responsive promoter family protein [Pleionea sediminis]